MAFLLFMKLQGIEKEPAFEVPSIREYYMDLDYVLNVISDGPTKSFAFRRLKYLASKWSMYSLLHEYEETADMKVSEVYPFWRPVELILDYRGYLIGALLT